jgi:UDP-N-acetylglucosamine--N-acetylmuramyl-(pentapeptide) pyrophosphoryl-undecaprenol N-acetylglucosamine transferase
MRIILTGGGTGGHVTPLLAIAEEFKARHPESKIVYIGQRHDSSASAMTASPLINRQFVIFAGKWRRYHGVGLVAHLIDIPTLLKNIRDLVYFMIGFCQCMFKMLFWRPKVVFSKGGYVSLPVGLAAAVLRIPVVTHDSDVIPGLSNKILSRYAKLVAVGWPAEIYSQYYPVQKLRYTGIPLRPAIAQMLETPLKDTAKKLGYSNNDEIITIIGGSLGAVNINNAVMQCLNKLFVHKNLRLIWLTGQRQYSEIKQHLASTEYYDRINLLSYSENIYELMMISKLVISRAGATTIAELAALSKAAIIIPSPFLANGHQIKNAQLLQNKHAAIIVQESEMQNGMLNDKIDQLLKNDALCQELGSNLHLLYVAGATANIVDVIEEAMR